MWSRYAALALVVVGIAGSVKAEEAEKRLYVVATAHLDTQWLWTIQDTIRECIPATLRDNFARCDAYPDYVFSFEVSFRYMLAREYYPLEYAGLKREGATGRWRVAGSAVDAGHTNIPAPEAIIRQVLHGDGFFGDTLSLVPPLTPTVDQVTLAGVEWPLAGATLTFGSTWSISNTLAAPTASLQIGQGMLLVVQIEASS